MNRPKTGRTRRLTALERERLLCFSDEPVRQPIVVADGLGVDSTAMLLGLHQRGIRPDLILHADTGGEHPETVAYIAERQRWLASVGFPALIVVRRGLTHGKMGDYTTLEQNCLVNETLPSLAFGRKACSLKYKRVPQDSHVRRWEPAKVAWAEGLRVKKLIGYDAGPKDARRSALKDDKHYQYDYPLREWGWDRERCIAEIRAAGLPVPRKSACFFCPSAKPYEIAELVEVHPDLADRIVAIEAAAAPRLRTVEGLWRTSTKGRQARPARPAAGRKKALLALEAVEARPGAMTTFILAERAKRRLPLVM